MSDLDMYDPKPDDSGGELDRLFAVYGSSPDEPLSINSSIEFARRNADVFARNGGRPVRIVEYVTAGEVAVVHPSLG